MLHFNLLRLVEIDGLDPQKREMLEARITGRVSMTVSMLICYGVCPSLGGYRSSKFNHKRF